MSSHLYLRQLICFLCREWIWWGEAPVNIDHLEGLCSKLEIVVGYTIVVSTDGKNLT